MGDNYFNRTMCSHRNETDIHLKISVHEKAYKILSKLASESPSSLIVEASVEAYC